MNFHTKQSHFATFLKHNSMQKKHILHIQNPWLNFWGSKFERCPGPTFQKGPMPPFPMTNSLKSWFPASFLSKGLMLPIAHPWWHADTQKKASSKHLLAKPALRRALPSLRMTKILSFQPTKVLGMIHQFVNDLRTSALRKETKKTFGLWAWRNHSSCIPPTKNISHRIEALVRQKGSCCCCVAVVVLGVCCCCFLWLSFLLLLLQFFSLVITCVVTLLDYNSYHSKLRAKNSRPWWYWSTNNGNSQQKHV